MFYRLAIYDKYNHITDLVPQKERALHFFRRALKSAQFLL